MRVYVGQNGVLEGRVLVVGLLGEDPPPLLDFGALLLYNLLLLDQVQRLGLLVDERLFEGLVVDFLQDGLQGVQRLLQHLVPVRVRNRCDDGDEQGEGGVLLGLQDGQELVVLEEAHRPVGHLQLRAGNTLDQALEQLLDQGLQLGDFAHLEHLQHFGEEHDLLGRVAEGPVAQQSLHQQHRQLGVLAQEEHRAAQQLLVVEVAGLHFVQGDDHRLEEVHVLLAQGHREPTDYARQDVQELRGAVELEVLVGQRVEGVRDGLADHLAARDQLGVEPVQDVLEVLALARLLGVEQLQELLDEGVRDENAQRAHLRGLVHNQLQEEVVDRLQVRPGGVHQRLVVGVHAHFGGRAALLEDGQGAEDVLDDHFDHQVQVRDHQRNHAVLLVEQLLQFGQVLQLLVLLLDVALLVVEVELVAAELDLLQELVAVLLRDVLGVRDLGDALRDRLVRTLGGVGSAARLAGA